NATPKHCLGYRIDGWHHHRSFLDRYSYTFPDHHRKIATPWCCPSYSLTSPSDGADSACCCIPAQDCSGFHVLYPPKSPLLGILRQIHNLSHDCAYTLRFRSALSRTAYSIERSRSSSNHFFAHCATYTHY